MSPQLSIITINLNNLEGLKKTMQSVFEQTFTDYEYIIIDGGSADGSKEYIERHADKLAYWVSEKDGGIYDALNKGSEMATGTYLHHLNSGDSYYADSVLQNLFVSKPDWDFFFGDMMLDRRITKRYPERLTFDFFLKDAVPHQATFIRRSFFLDRKSFSTAYKMGGDYEFFLKAVYIYQCSYSHISRIIVNYDLSGISSLNNREVIREFKLIREINIPNLIEEFIPLLQYKNKYFLLKNSRGVRIINKIKKLLRKNG